MPNSPLQRKLCGNESFVCLFIHFLTVYGVPGSYKGGFPIVTNVLLKTCLVVRDRSQLKLRIKKGKLYDRNSGWFHRIQRERTLGTKWQWGWVLRFRANAPKTDCQTDCWHLRSDVSPLCSRPIYLPTHCAHL